jgi:ribonuclease-3
MPSSNRLAGIDHEFADPALLETALTHRSAGRRHNERLEFLGDAVLGMVVSDVLYERHPNASEGELTRMRATIVRESTLAGIARSLALGDALRLGQGELASGGFRRESILADAFEAVVGAVFLDAGVDAVRRVLAPLLGPALAALVAGRVEKDAKTALQERLQADGIALPVYTLVATRGADHERSFVAACEIASHGIHEEGEGSSRRAAETEAARRALASLQRLTGAAS